MLTESGNAPLWLNDSQRLLFNDKGGLYLFNTGHKRVRQILSVPLREINPWLFGLSRDHRKIVFSVATTEADIWQMSLN